MATVLTNTSSYPFPGHLAFARCPALFPCDRFSLGAVELFITETRPAGVARNFAFRGRGEREARVIRNLASALILMFLLAVIQSTAAVWLRIHGVAPDLLLVATVVVGLLDGPRAGMGWGFAAGALQGALQGSHIGGFIVSKVFSGWLAGLLGSRLFRENWLVPLLSLAFITLLHEGLFALLSQPAGGPGWASFALGRAAYHAALGPPAFLAARGLKRWLTRPRP